MYKRDENFDKGYEDWCRSKKTSGLRKIISECVEAVREMAPDRGEDGEEDLKGKILAVCYAAWNYKAPPIADWPTNWRQKKKEFQGEIQAALDHCSAISNFIERQKLIFDEEGYPFIRKKMDKHGWVQYKINSPIQFDSKTRTVKFDIPLPKNYPPPHRVLNAYMQAFHDGLLDYLHELKNSKQPFQNCHGPLYYPNSLPKQAMKEKAELNGFLFHLVFIFRQYTNLKVKKDTWYQQKTGPMPSGGTPCFKQVADIANSLNQICTPNLSEKEFSLSQVKQVIYRLQENDVILNTWASPFFLFDYHPSYHTK